MQTKVSVDGARSTIAIADAIDLLAGKLGSVAEARQVLAERAQTGDVDCIASKANGPYDGKFLDDQDWPIPPGLWLRLKYHSDMESRRGDLTASPDPDRYAELRDDFETPLRMINVRIGLDSLNSILASFPIEWVNAHAAIEMLLPMFGKGMGLAAGMALAKRAHSGLLRTRAQLLKWDEPQTSGYGNRKVEREVQFASIPRRFWWAEGHEALTQNWVSGDFSTWIDRMYHWQAFGTEFARCDVEAMVPKRGPSTAEPVEREQPLDGMQESEDVAALPTDEAIEAKMQELIALGMQRDVAAKVIRQIKGFGAVGNEHARRVVNGKLVRGRPRKGA